MKDIVTSEFDAAYGKSGDPACYFAPGRINLIGEHTDYNGGHVFPCALPFGTYAAVRKRGDDVLRLASVNFPEDGVITCSLRDLIPLADHTWTAYVKGVIWAVMNQTSPLSGTDAAGRTSTLSEADAAGLTSCLSETDAVSKTSSLSGMDIMIGGDVPAGAGLSSSASLEVVVGYMLSDQFGLGLSNVDIALIGQKAENEFVGVSCGIMDQFASAMGRKDHAIFLDTNTLEYQYVPLDLEGCSIIITNTNKPHSLNDSAYNDRRRECSEALEMINKYIAESNEDAESGCGSADGRPYAGTGSGGGRQLEQIQALCQLSEEDFDRVKDCLTDPVILRRARHAVSEDRRTEEAVRVLRNGDIAAFGKLMNASHVSLRDDYEVSCPELDLLAETAWKIPGVLGSRMTGGGFGGCTVSIIRDSAVQEYEEKAGRKYREAFGYDCTFIRASADGGPALVDNKQ